MTTEYVTVTREYLAMLEALTVVTEMTYRTATKMPEGADPAAWIVGAGLVANIKATEGTPFTEDADHQAAFRGASEEAARMTGLNVKIESPDKEENE